MESERPVGFAGQGRSALDDLLRQSVADDVVPGVVVCLTDRQGLLYHGAFGHIDARREQAMPLDALFQIQSMTKPVTSVAIMMLAEQGLLNLDDPLARYLPEFSGRPVIVSLDAATGRVLTRPAAREVTLRHLLTHTSGLAYGFSNAITYALSGGQVHPSRMVPLLNDPGSRWTYGMSTRLLGEVVEKLSGECLDVFFEQRIFRPLGMNDSGFALAPSDRWRLTALFRREAGQLTPEAMADPYVPRVFGDGGLLSTSGDYGRFLRMLLCGGQLEGVRILSAESVSEMTRNQIGALTVEEQGAEMPHLANPFPLGAGEDKFGLGFQIRVGHTPGERASGSLSWAGLYNTHFWIDPQKSLAVVLLMQVLPFYDERCIRLLRDVERCVYAHVEWPPLKSCPERK